jgi:hypothetical protein
MLVHFSSGNGLGRAILCQRAPQPLMLGPVWTPAFRACLVLDDNKGWLSQSLTVRIIAPGRPLCYDPAYVRSDKCLRSLAKEPAGAGAQPLRAGVLAAASGRRQ